MKVTHEMELDHGVESLQRRAELLDEAHRNSDWSEAARLLGGIEESARFARHHLVQHLRENGASWQRVGDTLGITRQAAYERYKGASGPRSGPGQALRDQRQRSAVKES